MSAPWNPTGYRAPHRNQLLNRSKWNSDKQFPCWCGESLVPRYRMLTPDCCAEYIRRIAPAVYLNLDVGAAPKLWTTYRMEDGSDIYGEYAFVTDIEFFENDDGDECRVVKETWQLVHSEVLVFNEWVDEPDDDEPEPAP